MSNQIGELFKILGKNEVFANYVKEIENGKTNQEIIDIALNDEALMCTLTLVVSDVEVIKNKMDVIIGQKRKNHEKKIANETKEKSNVVIKDNKSNTCESSSQNSKENTEMNRSFSVDSSLFSGTYVKENTEMNRSYSTDSSLFSGTYMKENTNVKTDDEEEIFEFKSAPINPDNVVVFFDKFYYLEKVDHMLRLVTKDFEFYY